mgnify:CR=1 FL=1
MKYAYLLFFNLFLSSIVCAQAVFQSDLSSWSNGSPTDWMGSSSNIPSTDVHEISAGVIFGTSYASLINTTSTHKRFSTQPVTVTPGETYKIEIWVSAYKGDLRTNYFDLTNNSYGVYNSYEDLSVSSGSTTVQTLVSQTVTVSSTCTSAEFILSLKNTDPTGGASPWFLGILVDSVSISVSSPPTTSISIYDIQYSTASSGDSPYANQQVSTGGIVNYVRNDGSFYLQSGTGPWTGIYVYDSISNVMVGDSITVDGEVVEYYNLTELKNLSNLTVISSGNSVAVNNITTNDANSEPYEGCLVKVDNAECTNASGSFGEWTIDDSSGPVQVDDFLYSYTPSQGIYYTVTGLMDFNFSEFKMLPRDANDIFQLNSINNPTSTIGIETYPNPITEGILNVKANKDSYIKITNILGETVLVKKIKKGHQTIDVANLHSGNYVLKAGNFTSLITIK